MRRVLSPIRVPVALFVTIASGLAAACGDGGTSDDGAERPSVVVTTSIWGDVVNGAVGGLADVDVVIPIGADPHEFAASARQAERMENADVLVVNGLGLEAGMTGVVDNVARTGTPVVVLGDGVDVDVVESAEGGDDPHIWLDPRRVAAALGSLGEALPAATTLDRSATDDAIGSYVAELTALDDELEVLLAPIPPDRRKLVTNHDSLGYLADRYGFEIVGTVIPSTSTSASPSAAGLEALADVIRAEDVPAIFAETTESDQLAQALADEVGGAVAVVELFTGSLGEPGSGADTYAGMMRTNARRIAAALG